MDMKRYIAYLNDVIDLDSGLSRHPDGSVNVKDVYGNSHRLTPDIVRLLDSGLQASLEACPECDYAR
ncbi:MAG: hypothetical protein JWQ98_2363 [Chlorobi bacterium]|nr:hypothetical protein [Chlorobiota bacterium]